MTGPDAPARSPHQDLLAEHQLMATVLAAMEKEVERMLKGGELRPAFWSDVVDFNGNFVHRCHRVKEEEHLVPVLVAQGSLARQQQEAIREEHRSGRDLTLELCEAVGEADWEKVLRLVSIYLHILRPHMQREESGIFALAAGLPGTVRQQLLGAFDEVDRRVLADRGRRHFVTVARRLAVAAGVPHEVPDEPS